MTKIKLFLYGQGNIVGSALATVAVILYLSGLLGEGWWIATALAYALGYVASTVLVPTVNFEHETELGLDDLQHFLTKMLSDYGKQLPDESLEHLKSIKESLDQALPKFKDIFEISGSGGPEWMRFRKVILNYLPETLGNYLRLPRAYVNVHKVGETGKTPRKMLVEQLSVMDDELKTAVSSLFESDLTQMVNNSKFLESKFRKAVTFLD